MIPSSGSRRNRTNLLARPPCSVAMYDGALASLIIDPAEQINAVAGLVARGLLSQQEFEHVKSRLLQPDGAWPR